MLNRLYKTVYVQILRSEWNNEQFSQLKEMLNDSSNILSFQNRFEIFDEGEIGTDFIEWLYNTKSTNYDTLTENTSLQRNMKKHLLSGVSNKKCLW